MARVFSGIQPTGEVHLGNYLGAVRRWVRAQHEDDAIHCIVDLHALTIPQDPAVLGAKIIEVTQILVAAGLDPEVCTLFVQSQVAEHAELSWVMECTAAFGELRRMTQFKEKADQADFVRRLCSPIPRCRRPTSCSTTPRRCRWVTTSANISSWPATWRTASTTATARRSWCRSMPSPRRRPGHGPAASGTQDVQVRRLAAGHGARARRARRDPSQVPAGGYGQRIRGALRPNGQTGGGQPAVDPGGRDRRQARGARRQLQPVRAAQGRTPPRP